jgi:hypothetical protein
MHYFCGITPDDCDDPRVVDLLRIHLNTAGRKPRPAAHMPWISRRCDRPTSTFGRFWRMKFLWASAR